LRHASPNQSTASRAESSHSAISVYNTHVDHLITAVGFPPPNDPVTRSCTCKESQVIGKCIWSYTATRCRTKVTLQARDIKQYRNCCASARSKTVLVAEILCCSEEAFPSSTSASSLCGLPWLRGRETLLMFIHTERGQFSSHLCLPCENQQESTNSLQTILLSLVEMHRIFT
jgi:hypothetical protein